jgi:hypothetical protein
MMKRAAEEQEPANGIGTLREMSLHASVKDYYAQPGDHLEVPVAGYLIDIERGKELIEIQTANFGSLKSKLDVLLDDFQVTIVYPIARERWIRRVSIEGEVVSRRKSPKRGRVEQLFDELIYIPQYLRRENLSVEALMIQDEITWLEDGRGSWRRKGWSVQDRRLLAVIERHEFCDPADYLALIPESMSGGFTNRDLAESLSLPIRLAQKMSNCLRKMDLIEQAGKSGRAYLYRVGELPAG